MLAVRTWLESVRQEDVAQPADGVEPGLEVDVAQIEDGVKPGLETNVAPPPSVLSVVQPKSEQPLPSPVASLGDATGRPQ